MLAQSLTSLASVSSVLKSSVPSSLAPHTETARVQISALWSSAKPWGEFFNGKKFVPPGSASELQERLMDNLSYFSANYVVCFLVLSAASVLIHPMSFVCIVLLVALYVYMFLQHTDAIALGAVTLSVKAKKGVFATTGLALVYATNAVGIIGSWALFAVFVSLIHAGCRVSVKEPDFDSPVNAV